MSYILIDDLALNDGIKDNEIAFHVNMSLSDHDHFRRSKERPLTIETRFPFFELLPPNESLSLWTVITQSEHLIIDHYSLYRVFFSLFCPWDNADSCVSASVTFSGSSVARVNTLHNKLPSNIKAIFCLIWR